MEESCARLSQFNCDDAMQMCQRCKVSNSRSGQSTSLLDRRAAAHPDRFAVRPKNDHENFGLEANQPLSLHRSFVTRGAVVRCLGGSVAVVAELVDALP